METPNIVYVKGDLLESWSDGVTVIGHQCNCRGTWRGGIHKAIGEKWPHVVRNYRRFKWEPGDCRVFWAAMHERPFRVAYLAGQDGYGNSVKTGIVYTDYAALAKAMETLRDWLSPEDVLAFPLIGAGLAGGDWNIIAAMISEVFADRTVRVYEL